MCQTIRLERSSKICPYEINKICKIKSKNIRLAFHCRNMQSVLYFEIALLKYIYVVMEYYRRGVTSMSVVFHDVVYWLVVVGFGAWFFDATAFKVKAK